MNKKFRCLRCASVFHSEKEIEECSYCSGSLEEVLYDKSENLQLNSQGGVNN